MRNSDKPIYPIQSEGFPSRDTVLEEGSCSGLTKREYFAAIAMQGLLSKYNNPNDIPPIAKIATQAADALLSELEKTKP